MWLQPQYQDTKEFQTFWKQGNGKELIDMSGAQVSLEGFDEYAHLYYEADTLGDLAVKDLFFTMPFTEAYKRIENYAVHGIDDTVDVPESVRNLFMQMQTQPDWLNTPLLQAGAELCMRSGLNALVVLRDFTLMGGYDYAYLNKPLIFTGALKKGAVKRLTDTLDFWVNVTRVNALQIHAKGYEFCAKTRMIHSYSRLMILEKMKNWNTKQWGLPVNSWDMIATYIGFSLTFCLGLKKLGMEISEEEELGLFHLWKYVGYLIGIPAEYIPDNAREATEQFYLWSSIQPSSDVDSVMLAKFLLNENLESTIYKRMYMRKRLRYLHICCNWFLLDAETNKRLQIPDVSFKNAFPKLLIMRNKRTKSQSRNKQVMKGDKAQQKVLNDYLIHSPRNTHG